MKRIFSIIVSLGLIVGAVAPTAAYAQSNEQSVRYVALGDSVSAGAGLPSLSGPSQEDELCDRSSQAYPYQVAAALGTTVTQLACSGAKVDEGVYGEQTIKDTDISPQLNRAFENGTPDIITITVGANDARWVQAIRDCYIWHCGSKFDVFKEKAYRADLRAELGWTLYKINEMSNGHPPRVLLSGYYSPFTTLDCTGDSRITSSEQKWLRDQSAMLNQAIRSVVPYFSFAEYVPIDFSGHELCAEDPWIQGTSDTAPFHPTAEGQSAIARAFVNALSE